MASHRGHAPRGGHRRSRSPSRWAFEGLLLLESQETANLDLAETYFPADSQRMGLRADTMALVFMLIGLAGAAAFISVSAKPR